MEELFFAASLNGLEPKLVESAHILHEQHHHGARQGVANTAGLLSRDHGTHTINGK